ncbi:MAG: UvrABC system protein A [Syntrophomonadaceae bacterium]|nr:UvrABC system protein A [Bacillota bacterium]
MIDDSIIVRRARTNNLKDLSVSIPKHKLVVFTGVSGSGKSSLVFDTIYTEAQRQLIETFSTFARARLPKLSRPDVDDIENLSTAIVIDQKRMGSNLRSTVGTATEINTYLRLFYSRFGKPFIGPSFLFSFNHPDGMCAQCHGLGKQVRVDVSLLLDKEKSIREGGIVHPEWKVGGWNWRELVAINLFDVDKKLKDFKPEELSRLLYTAPVPVTKPHGSGTYAKHFEGIARRLERLVAEKAEDERPDEQKDVYRQYYIYFECIACRGTRLNDQARSVMVNGVNIGELCDWELADVAAFLAGIEDEKAVPVIRKARYLLEQLIEIGVGYLTLSRPVSTLSGGESQRVKMARQLDCNLSDLLYVLDEPTIGLHPRDTERLLSLLYKLKDRGNSVFVVEHDPDIIRAAEWIVDIGPKAGQDGGKLVYTGPAQDFKDTGGITEEYLQLRPKPELRRKRAKDYLVLENVSLNNLQNVTVRIPTGVLTCVTGVAGSGKSSLINQCFVERYPAAVVIDQSAIGRTSRGNPATFSGVFGYIRKEFALATGKSASLFSFNSGGACAMCGGQGFLTLELHFLDAVRTTCDVCQGTRFRQDVLEFTYSGRSIADVLDMTVDSALAFFERPEILKRLQVMKEVGLGYLKIGQSLSTLSGGESQRLKLAAELHKQGNIYVMDEPTTGLHLSDIARLYGIIRSLTDRDNTVIIIEHNLDIIKFADWIIDLGPGGGKNGGKILFQGVPEELINCPASYTGQFLKTVL